LRKSSARVNGNLNAEDMDYRADEWRSGGEDRQRDREKGRQGETAEKETMSG